MTTIPAREPRLRVAFRVPAALWTDAQVKAAVEGGTVTGLVERALSGAAWPTPGLPRALALAAAVAHGRSTGTRLVGVRLPPQVAGEIDRRADSAGATRTTILCDALAIAVMGDPREVAAALVREGAA